MRALVFIGSILFGLCFAKAQSWDSTYSSLLQLDSEQFQNILQYYEDHPIPINAISFSELCEIELFTKKQAWGIKVYRNKYGEIRSEEELVLVLGFTEDFVALIQAAINFSSNQSTNFIQYDVLQFYEQENAGELKSVSRHQFRRRGSFGVVNASMVRRLKTNQDQTLDGFFTISPKAKQLNSSFILGHYRMDMGSGLLLGNSWNWNHPFYIQDNRFGIRARGVTNQNSENTFFGACSAIEVQSHTFLFANAFQSDRDIQLFSYQNNNRWLGFNWTGLRDRSRNAFNWGGQLFHQQDYWRSTFDFGIDHNEQKAVLWSFSGWTENGLEGKLELMHYDEHYSAPFAGATSGSGKVDNEKAMVLLLKKGFGRLTSGVKIHLSQYLNPKRNYRGISEEQIFSVHGQYEKEKFSYYQQFEINKIARITQVEVLNHQTEVLSNNLKSKTQISIELNEGIKTVLGVNIQKDNTVQSFGRSLFTRWKVSKSNISFNYQLGGFHCKAYEVRNYHYIPRLRYSMNVRMFYGKGFYNVLSMKKEWGALVASIALFHQYFSRFNNEWSTFQHQFSTQFMLEWKIKKFGF